MGQANLGSSYATGQGVAKDYAEAVNWFRKAAEQNDAKAQSNLGGCGVASDDESRDEVGRHGCHGRFP
jgi:TPR repeat protein